jgi:hypothetical protein
MRLHTGERGALSDRFSVSHASLMGRWREFGRTLFRRVRNDFALLEYLPKGTATGPPAGACLRRAYLQRMTVMASKGMMEEMLQDLRDAVNLEGLPSLTAVERGIVQRAMDYLLEWKWLEPVTPEWIAGVRAVCSMNPIGREIQREFLRSSYWRFRALASAKRYRAALGAAALGARIGR